MIRRTVRVVAVLGALGGIGAAIAKILQGRRSGQAHMPSGDPLLPKRSETPLVEPKMFKDLNLRPAGEANEDEPRDTPPQGPRVVGPQAPSAAARPAPQPSSPAEPPSAPAHAWVEPDGAACPATHPVKAKLASGIFHLPGMTAYERTTADRCYRDEAAAEADGLRKAKR